MNHIILDQMNSATRPAKKEGEAVRQIRNYFVLLTNMMKLGLQLIWEKKNGLRYFDGIMNSEMGREVYDDIVRCVMRPEEENSGHFQPEEIDAIAAKLSTRGLATADALDYLRRIIAAKIENEELQSDGDTHAPTLHWAPLEPHEAEAAPPR